MARFHCARFPKGRARIRTTEGLVDFHDGIAHVDDETIAAALREVSPVFEITEEEPPVEEPSVAENEPSSPPRRRTRSKK